MHKFPFELIELNLKLNEIITQTSDKKSLISISENCFNFFFFTYSFEVFCMQLKSIYYYFEGIYNFGFIYIKLLLVHIISI